MKLLSTLLVYTLTGMMVLLAQSARIHPALLAQTASGEKTECFILMRQQAECRHETGSPGKAEKGRRVYDLLRNANRESQGQIQQVLSEMEVDFIPFFIVNGLWARVDREGLDKLARLDEVATIIPNGHFRVPYDPLEGQFSIQTRSTAEWGIRMIGADQVWAMGYRGQGAVIGGQDTGYDWDHPALFKSYRGWDSLSQSADHAYNWHDAIHEINPLHQDSTLSPTNNPCGLDSPAPCDDHSHGTHTMGTMAGLDGDNEIGLAPDARWIGCRNMERGFGSLQTYLECFQWFLAPTDLQNEIPNPALAPHVINNSWVCPNFEGCDTSNYPILELAVDNLTAAGIMVVASAGNDGYGGCGTVHDPPAIFANSFSVGATGPNDSLAAFSSRGPVRVDGSYRLKPDISAPGVSIRSSLPNSNYGFSSGTSMAGPHVAGVIALIISANPDLAGQVDLLSAIIRETAVPKTAADSCGQVSGAEIPNNQYGYGRIDALAAVERALELSDLENPSISTESPFRFFPNPSAGDLYFRNEGAGGQVRLSLFDLRGRVFWQKDFFIKKGEVRRFAGQDLPDGLFHYRIQMDGKTYTGRIVRIKG